MKLHLYNVILWPAGTGISYGFGVLNDAQAALTLVSLRTHTRKGHTRPKIMAGNPFRINFCTVDVRQSWHSDKQGQIISFFSC